jgi:hypothetical protein
MGIFNRNRSASSGEHLPAFKTTDCVGEACPNFSGENCTDPEMEWMSAGGPTERRDTSKPPLKDEATYIIYGQRCLKGASPELVAQRVEVFKPEDVDMMEIVALTGRYGDMLVEIISGEQISTVEKVEGSE